MITINMTGTEKQIAWANDIINTPVTNVEYIIAQWNRPGFESLAAAIPAIRSAIARYETDMTTVLAPKLADAKFVIEKRSRFSAMLRAAISEAVKAEGHDHAIIIANLHL